MQKLKEMLDKKILLLLVGFLFVMDSFGQCAMCKAAVEANLEAGDDIGSGLNSGILYLMSMPYIAVFSFALFYYLQKRKTPTT
ncbi:hypothetical protein OAX10_02620 [Flavobacteriales bacterium]|jgi:hypothetical protein|nr:hypothetical protein [Flavobacteriales bacterium]